MVDSYLVSFAGLLLTLGMLGDRFGRKRALQTGIALFGLSSLAVLFVETSTQLIAVRALMGVGGALIMPATLSIITNVFPREERAKAIGVWAGTAAIGVGLGPLFGGLLLEYFDWSSVFLINVPVALVAFVAGIRFVPDSRDPNPGRFDAPGALLSIGALVALIYAVIEAPERGWLDPVILGAFGGALALGRRVRGLGAAHRGADARPEPVPQPALQHRLAVDQPRLLLAVRRDLRAHPVPAVRQGLLAAGGRRGDGAARLRPDARRDALGRSSPSASAPPAWWPAGSSASARCWRRPCCGRATCPYWPIGLWFFGVALSMGCIMGPATALGHGRGAQGEGRRRRRR